MEELLKGVPPNVAIKNISDQQAGALSTLYYSPIMNILINSTINTEVQYDTLLEVCQQLYNFVMDISASCQMAILTVSFMSLFAYLTFVQHPACVQGCLCEGWSVRCRPPRPPGTCQGTSQTRATEGAGATQAGSR